MYFNGQIITCESEDDEDMLIEAISALGEFEIVEFEQTANLKVASYSFIMIGGESGFTAITGQDQASDMKLRDLYIACGGNPEEYY